MSKSTTRAIYKCNDCKDSRSSLPCFLVVVGSLEAPDVCPIYQSPFGGWKRIRKCDQIIDIITSNKKG